MTQQLPHTSIRVNVASPGPTDTELFNQGKSEEDRQRMAKMAALSRLGTPIDIARVVSQLLSEDTGWLTGKAFEQMPKMLRKNRKQ